MSSTKQFSISAIVKRAHLHPPLVFTQSQRTRSQAFINRRESRAESLINRKGFFNIHLTHFVHMHFSRVESSKLKRRVMWCGWKLRLRFASCHENRNAKTQFAVNMKQASDSRGSKSDTATKLTETYILVSSLLAQTRSQLIKAGVKLLIQSKRKNSGSSSCDADYRPPPPKIRSISASSPVSRNIAIPCEEPSPIMSPKEEPSPFELDSFNFKTDSNSSCDEDDSEHKFSANKHEVIKVN